MYTTENFGKCIRALFAKSVWSLTSSCEASISELFQKYGQNCICGNNESNKCWTFKNERHPESLICDM